MKLRKLGLWFMALVAVTAFALAGCAKAVETPLTFATANPRIGVPTLVQGLPMAEVTLPEASGGAGALTYSVTPMVPGLTFDTATRVLGGTPVEAGAYSMTYTATAAGGKTASLSFTVTVVDRLSFGSLTLPDVSVAQDSAVSGVALPPAVGGTGALTYRLTPMVPGLTFDATTRVLSGMPTTPGIYPMTYDVIDSAQGTASLSFTIAVVGFGRTTLDDVSYDQDSAIASLSLPEAIGGTLAYSLTPAVPGLTFDAATRVLSGTPTKAGMYSLTYTATDAQGTTASLDFALAVLPSLRGTWMSDDFDWWEDDEPLGTFVDVVTFTKERFIMFRAHYRHDGTLVSSFAESGTWGASGNTVTRTWLENHDDDDETPDILRSISKYFVWADETRDLLLMHNWAHGDEEPVGRYLESYRRVSNPIPSPIGVWRATDEWDQGPVVFTITVSADGMFDYQLDEVHGTENVIARWELDEDNYYLNISDAYTTFTPIGGSPQRDREGFSGTGRFAYAPTDGSPDEMIVSFHWDEENEERPFGDYWKVFARQ